ncbi:MAG: single-stranded-DNA-specific exonuclease RecJ [Chloroflexi bacterium RBG_13_56_8]|nr:MAG: single-stranded-DNA-specific exonuclease RecJ [Chloroflexi bacterium RBG_13_56_8]
MPHEWRIAPQKDVPPALREAVGGHPLVARLLTQRGFTDPQQARAFLDPTQYTPASPYELEGMERAISLLNASIERGERVRIWGDFDADGETATVVLFEALSAAGAKVDYDLPLRNEGHGLHPRAVTDALRDGVSALITCDTGIGDGEVVAQGVRAGLTVIITDHHDLPEELPIAQAVIDPKMLSPNHPLRELTGVGVAYMVARALLADGEQAQLLEEMLDLVALGLVADVAVQVADVRYLIQRGLEVLRGTQRLGLLALIRAFGSDTSHLDSSTIGYELAPRLNAAGRLADAHSAVRLLLTHDEQEAESLAQEMESLNRDRKARQEAVLAQAEERLARDPQARRRPAIVLEGENWSLGVLGLVAGDLAHRYERPAILIAHREGEPSVGSARSVEGIDIHQAIASQREHLVREGGHPMAAGFSIPREEVAAFTRGLWDWLGKKAPQLQAPPELVVDAEIPWRELNLTLAREVARLGPFGSGNPRPLLMTGGGSLVRVEDISRQRETPHRRLHLDDDEGSPLRFVWFNAGDLPETGERLDLAFYLATRSWRGEEHLQLELADWHPATPPAREALANLVAGREVVDWRKKEGTQQLLVQLRAMHGENILVWAEGLPSPDGEGLTRSELVGRRAPALAILTAPPGPEALRWVLSEVQPQVIYLLPPRATQALASSEFIAHVAGMLRVALRDHDGWIDALRMAGRIGARRASVIAALRGLEARGKIALRYEEQGLRAYLPSETPEDIEMCENGVSAPPEDTAECRNRAEEQARAALSYLLRETQAYRQAYATQPVEALLSAEP